MPTVDGYRLAQAEMHAAAEKAAWQYPDDFRTLDSARHAPGVENAIKKVRGELDLVEIDEILGRYLLRS